MKICKIWDSDYPWDVRVEKICKTLISAKHEVHLICRNKKIQKTYELIDGIHIHRLPCIIKNKKLNEIISFPAFFNPLWIYKIWKIIKEHNIEIIIVRDLPLALTAISIGRIIGLPVILDMAENYPEMINDLWTSANFRLRNLFIRNPLAVKVVELVSIKYVDHIIVVVEESAERLIKLGINSDKITIMMNTPPLSRLSYSVKKLYPGSLSNLKDDFIIIYLGLLEYPRGIETAISAMRIIVDKTDKCKLVILGNGKDEQKFKELVYKLNLNDNVLFEGWVDYRRAFDYICSSDIGLVPHHATRSWNTTIPNKLFDYMSFGKPVIVSDAIPTKRIVEKERCGLVFKDRDPRSLSSAIIELYENKEFCKELGNRGKRAIESKYNWERESIKLIEVLNRLLKDKK